MAIVVERRLISKEDNIVEKIFDLLKKISNEVRRKEVEWRRRKRVIRWA